MRPTNEEEDCEEGLGEPAEGVELQQKRGQEDGEAEDGGEAISRDVGVGEVGDEEVEGWKECRDEEPGPDPERSVLGSSSEELCEAGKDEEHKEGAEEIDGEGEAPAVEGVGGPVEKEPEIGGGNHAPGGCGDVVVLPEGSEGALEGRYRGG